VQSSVTGLILAGGKGSRMGGVDKGLQTFRGRRLVDHVYERFAPQRPDGSLDPGLHFKFDLKANKVG